MVRGAEPRAAPEPQRGGGAQHDTAPPRTGGGAAAQGGAMLRGCGRGAAAVLRRAAGSRGASGQEQGPGPGRPPEPSLLRFLVCPLSKRPLRYEESTNELINEELGIAYPIIDGIPNMIPEAARSTQKRPPAGGSEQP
uniref:Protein preY, mitochondrial n=1 Tax=Pavo cristatus TaxID=9049 RepID=A0A8C9FLX7_PAVCR